MALEVDQQQSLAGHLRHRFGQGRQQHVVGARAVGLRHLLDQRLGGLGVEVEHDHRIRVFAVDAVGEVERQRWHLTPCRVEPVPQLVVEAPRPGALLEPPAPQLERRRLRRQPQRLTSSDALVGPDEVFHQHLERDVVGDQVVNDDDQKLPRLVIRPLLRLRPLGPGAREARVRVRRELDQREAHQRRLVHPEAPLERRPHRFERPVVLARRQAAQIHRRERRPRRHAAVELLPLPARRRLARSHLPIPQPKPVVVRQQPRQHPAQQTRLDPLLELEHHRQVRMVQRFQTRLQEPPLHRQQGRLARHQPLLRHHLLRRAHHPRQLRHRRVLEDLPRRRPQPQAVQAGRDLDAQDRVPAQLEEVVVDPHPIHPQHLLPHRRHLLLDPVARRHVGRRQRRLRRLRRRQRPPIDLAVGRQRERFEGHPRARHHVLGQTALEVIPQLLAAEGLVRSRDHVGHQPRLPRLAGQREDQALADPLVGRQYRLDLPQLDAEASDLHLVVDAAQVDDLAVPQTTRQVPRPVQAGPRLRRERIRYEALRRQTRTVEIAPRQTRAADVELSRNPHRHHPPAPVEEIDVEVRDRLTDGAPVRRRQVAETHRTVGDVHRRLGDPVHVHQPRTVVPVALEPRRQRRQLEGFRTEDHEAQRQRRRRLGFRGLRSGEHLALRRHQLPEVRRRLVEHRHPFATEERVEVLRRTAHPIRHHHHAAAVEQRSPQLPHREVEGVGVEHRPHVLRPEAVPLLRRREEPQHLPVGDLHALGLTRRPRRVDHVGQAVGVSARLRRRLRVSRQALPVPVETQHLERALRILGQFRDLGQRRLVGQQQRRPRVAQAEGQTRLRVRRVEGQVGAAGLEDAEDPHHRPATPCQAQTHRHLGADAPLDQRVGQAVGQGVELAIGQRPRLVGQRRRRWRPSHMRREGLDQRPLNRQRLAPRRPLGHQLVTLRRAEQRQP